MKKRFEHYIDHQEEKSEKTILYGKAIMIAMTGGHVHSWTKFQKKVYYNHDTMTFEEIGSKLGSSKQNAYKAHRSAVKKVRRIIQELLKDRDYFRTI